MRPVRYYDGVPSPVKHPEYVDMVIFRENTEDIYAGMEFANGTDENRKFKQLFKDAFPKEYAKMRFPDTAGIGLKPVSVEGTERLVRAAIRWALQNKRKKREPRPQGQHHEVHRGRLQGLGLRTRQARVPQRDRHRARDLDPGQPGKERGSERGRECAHDRSRLRHDVARSAKRHQEGSGRRRSSCGRPTAKASGSPNC